MIWQLILNGFSTSSSLALMAIGFAVIYNVTRFFHFAHGVVFTSGAYLTYLFHVCLGLPFLSSILLSIIISILIGCSIEKIIYKPLRHKRTSPLILFFASLGVYIILQNVISMIFGDEIKSIRVELVTEGISVLGARITNIQILIILSSIVSIIIVTLLMKKSKMGVAMRAVANNSELANISGIESDRVILSSFVLGSALAGMAGILISLDVDMTPVMGLNALMMGVVAVIIGGMGSIPGVALGALLLGMGQNLGVWKINTQWQEAIAFAILLIFLLFRPQGFFGGKIKKAEV